MSRDYRDIIGGMILAAAGLFWAFYARSNYELGTLRVMDSGMFPMWLGFLLCGLGLVIAGMAFLKTGNFVFPKPDWRTLFFVLLSVAIFAVGVRRIGVIPSVILQTVVVSFADNKLGHIGKGVLALSFAAVVYLVFYLLLEIPLPLFEWKL